MDHEDDCELDTICAASWEITPIAGAHDERALAALLCFLDGEWRDDAHEPPATQPESYFERTKELWVPGKLVRRRYGTNLYLVISFPYFIASVSEMRVDLMSCQSGQIHRAWESLLSDLQSDWVEVT